MLNVGVIGVGSMGQNHARVYSEIANLIGIADAEKEKVEAVTKRFNTKGYTDFQELLSIPDLDAVSISTPTSTHFDVASKAIDFGKHVLLEKPMTADIEKASKLIEQAKDQGVVLAVGFIERHNPVVGFTKELIENGSIGKVISVVSRRVSSFPQRIKDVGVIFDLGIHDIDVIRYLLNSEVESIYTLAGKAGNTTLEDHANVLLEFDNGISGLVEINWLTPMKVRKVTLTCSKNLVELDYITQTLEVSSSMITKLDMGDLFRIPQQYDVQRIELQKQEPLKNELQDFLKAVSNGSNPLVTGEEGLKTLKIAHAAMKSVKNKEKVVLERI
jgi:UDP-N-acetylglucosamine 3-dehydrogenase